MSTAFPVSHARRERAAPASRGRIAREQALVTAAQLTSGVGNLLFALVAARILAPRGFAQLAAFLGLYLLVHVPAASLSAGTALAPSLAAARRHQAIRFGAIGAAALVLLAVPLSALAGVPVTLLLALAAALPAAGWLALERGRLYGTGLHAHAAASLGIEPVARFALGIPLMLLIGATGGAIAVVAGGFAALAVARLAPVHEHAGATDAPQLGREALWATLAFLALAVVQNQDVVLANALLPAGDAGRFAVLSTIGGAAAFATTTVPFVLLPRAARHEPHALSIAVGATIAIGALAVIVVALIPSSLIGAAFGQRYESVAPLAIPYVAAMALLGFARVLVAHGCAQGQGRRVADAAAGVAVLQAIGLVALGNGAGSVAHVTLAATAALAVLALVRTGAVAIPLPAPRRPLTAILSEQLARPAIVALAGITFTALVVRLVPTRGIWLDEATSITQAQMSLGGLFKSLGSTDVHPPLHHLILWMLAHTAGTSEIVMRLPSILAGAALVPVLFALGRELYDERAGLLAAALGAFAPLLVWYSQEARMYGLFMLFAALAMLAQLRALRRQEKRDWILYGVSTALLIWTQYFSILFVGVQQVVFALVAWRMWRSGRPISRYLKGWLGATGFVVLALLPLIGFAVGQFDANQAAGRGFDAPQQAGHVSSQGAPPGIYSALTNVVWAVVGYHSNGVMAQLTALWPLAMLGALLMLGRRIQARTMYVLACALVPAAGLFAIGFMKPFLFEVRYFAATAPLLIVLVARGATGWTRGAIATAAVCSVLVGGMGLATADQQLNGSNPRVYDFEGAIGQVRQQARKGDVVLYEPFFIRDVIRYYGADLRSEPMGDKVPKGTRRVFLVASFQDLASERGAVRKGLRALEGRFRLRAQLHRPQIHIWVLERRKAKR